MAVARQFKTGTGVTVRGALEGLSEAHGTWGIPDPVSAARPACPLPLTLRVRDLSWKCDYTPLSKVSPSLRLLTIQRYVYYWQFLVDFDNLAMAPHQYMSLQ